MNLANMKVGARLGLGFALVLVLLVVVTVVGIVRMAQIQNRLDHVVSVSNVVTRLVVDMRNNVSERVRCARSTKPTPPLSSSTRSRSPGAAARPPPASSRLRGRLSA